MSPLQTRSLDTRLKCGDGDPTNLCAGTKVCRNTIEYSMASWSVLGRSITQWRMPLWQARPLMCIEQQAHYFPLVCSMQSERLQADGVLGQRTRALVDALSTRRLNWLRAISIESIIELRKNNQNSVLLQRLRRAVDRLQESDLGNVDRVAAEICTELDGAMTDHKGGSGLRG